MSIVICALVASQVVVTFVLASTVRSLSNRILVASGKDAVTLVREERRKATSASVDDPPPLSPDASGPAWSEDFAKDFDRTAAGAQQV